MKTWQRIAGAGLLLLTCLELAWIASYSFQRMPSFDGSMNLQVAWSLSKGEGYRRTYADRPAFPPEVQTNVPLTVPAAVAFRLFGLGTVQAQLVNVLYLVGLAGFCFIFMLRRFGWFFAGACSLLIVTTPGILLRGLDGYGEVIGLFWFVAALLLYPWTASGLRRIRMILAGVCLGLALCTKIVMAICVSGFLLTLVLLPLLGKSKGWEEELRALLLVVAGIAIPLLGVELWRLISVGGVTAYLDWWWKQLTAVGRQAGVVTGYRDTSSFWSKLLLHLKLLSEFYGLPQPVTAAWIVTPFVLSALFLRRRWEGRAGALLCVLVVVAIYFVWWLAVTPTQKAWHRRILNGTLLLNLAWVYVAALSLELSRRARPSWLRRAAVLPLLFSLGLTIFFFFARVEPVLSRGPEYQEDVQEAIELLEHLPPDAKLCGIGWYSAPTLSLFSKRPLDDFNDLIISAHPPGEPVYIVLDQSAIALRKGETITATYRSRPLLPDAQRVQIYEVDVSSLTSEPPESEAGQASPILDLSEQHDPFIGGFYGVRNRGGRWMTSDAYVNLRYDGSPHLGMTVEAAAINRYVHPDGLRLSFFIEGCEVGEAHIAKRGRNVIQLPIPEVCRPSQGEVATVRISSDNLLDSGIMIDDRAMSVIAMMIGFVSTSLDLGEPETPERERIPGIGVGELTEEVRPVLDTVLRASPNPADFCTEERQAVEITWDLSAADPGAIQIWLEEPDGRRKLWIATWERTGTKQSGDWVVEGMTFIAVDATHERFLNRVEIQAADCP